MAKRAYKSVVVCPECGKPMIFRQPAKKEHLDHDAHLITHYTECKQCGTRCRTVTHSVVIRRGQTEAEAIAQ